MPIGIRDEHEAAAPLAARVVRVAVPCWRRPARRSTLRPTHSRRSGSDLAAHGTLGIHLPEEFGGQGAGLVELAVAAEELGRAAAPGPWATTVVVGAVLAEHGAPAQGVPPRGSSTAPRPRRSSTRSASPDGRREPRPGLVGTRRTDGAVWSSKERSSRSSTAPWSPSCWPRWRQRDRRCGCSSNATMRGPSKECRASTRHGRRRRGRSRVRSIPPARILTGATTERVRDLALLVAVRRGGRRRTLVPRRRGGARTDSPPVRQADRPVPRREASPRRHAGPARAVGGRDVGRGHLGRRGVRRGGRPEHPGAGPSCRCSSLRLWHSTATSRRPTAPSRCSAGWVSPGSTTRTSTSGGPRRSASSSAAPLRCVPSPHDSPCRGRAGD